MILAACLCALSLAAAAATAADLDLQGVTRVYVEAIPAKHGADQLQERLIAQLRHLHELTVVTDPAAADAVLHADGEVWISGYRSLNPRAGSRPSNGRAVYGGFLSVELKTASGETLWSDLANETATEDVFGGLAKQIAKHLEEARRSQEERRAAAADRPGGAPVNMKGAGATFPAPIYAKWFASYARRQAGVSIAYEPVGSEEGLRRLLAGQADFGACDHPAIFQALASASDTSSTSDASRTRDYVLVPSVIGAVVPIVNLPNVTEQIALTPDALADIYLGTITRWNDPRLREANRGLALPDLAITVVHRAEGSGTSYTWTSYLAQGNPAWRTRVGVSASPRWPIGQAASGNDDVARLVAQTPGAIGYVEFIYALHAHLSQVRVRNRAGAFVSASLDSLAAAAGSAPASDDLTSVLIDPASPSAYPMTTFTWLVIPAHIADANTRAALTGFLHWMLTAGQRQAAALGYLALPRAIARRADALVDAIAATSPPPPPPPPPPSRTPGPR